MGVVKNLMVRAGADFSAITKQSNKAKASMKGMSTSVGRSCNQMTAAAAGLKKAFKGLGAVLSVTAIVTMGKNAKAAYDEQAEASAKLAQVMRNTMGAGQSETQAIEDLIAAQERLGAVTGDVQTEGAQELATYLTMSSSLKTLIPVMNDMVAQQYGLAASAESAVSIATMMGKVMNGQTSALSRYGYSFTAAQEAVLKYGTEAQRAAVLAEVVSESVGGMNQALAATPNGRLKQVEVTLGNIQETFGLAINRLLVLLIPALTVLCSMLERVAVWADKVAQTLVKVFGSGPGSGAASVVATDAMAESIDGVTDAAESAADAVGGLLGIDQINKLSSNTAAGIDDGSSGAAVGSLIDTSGADAAGETLGWLETRLTSLQEKFAAVDTSKLTGALGRLKEAVAPFKEDLFAGLSWALDNVFVPMGTWAVEDGLPAFLGLLSGGCDVLSAAVDRFAPWGAWLWDNFLQPAASWAGENLVRTLGDVSDRLSDISDVLSGNITFGDFIANLEPMEQVALSVAAACAAVTQAAKGLAAISAITAFVGGVKGLKSTVGPLGKVAQVLALVLGGAGTFGEALTTVFGSSSVVGKLVEALALASGGAGTLSEALSAVFGTATTAFAGITGVVSGVVMAVTSLISMLKNGFSWAKEALMVLGVALAAVGAVVLGAPATVAAAIAGIVAAVATLAVVIKDNWESIRQFFADLWADVKGVFQGFLDFFMGGFTGDVDRATQGIGEIFGGLRSAVSRILDAVSGIFTGFFDSLESLTGGKLTFVVTFVKEAILNAVDWIKESLSGLLDSYKEIFSGITSFMSGVFSGDWTRAWSGLVGIGKGSINLLISFVESFVNFFVKGINTMIGALNSLSIDVPDWVPGVGGESFGFSIPTIKSVSLPRLATGSVVPPNNEFAAILGDNKHEPEIVSPVSLMESAFRNVLQELGLLKGGGSPTKVVIPIYVGGRKVSEKVIEDINDITRTTGECPIKV